VCTYKNPDGAAVCEICGAGAPQTAMIIVKSEEEIKREKEEEEARIKKEAEEIERKEKERIAKEEEEKNKRIGFINELSGVINKFNYYYTTDNLFESIAGRTYGI
jgi:uncharacterized Zn finger protein (UPF0148 family)